MALAILLAASLCFIREKRYELPKDTSLNLSLLVIPFALVFARLYYVVFALDQFVSDPLSVFDVRSGGMAIYGGIIGGVLAGWILSRKAKIPMTKLCDLAAPALALGQGIGRWGNFINQEAYGYAVLNPSFQFFPFAVYIESDGLWHLATFFYESLWCVLLCAFLLVMEARKKHRFSGEIFTWYVLLYAVERAFVEGLRTDSLMLGSLRISQILSLVAATCAAALLLIKRRKIRSNGRDAK